MTFINWARAKFHHEGLWLTSTVVVACTVGTLLPSAMRGIKFQGIPSFYMRYLSLCAILVVVAAWQGGWAAMAWVGRWGLGVVGGAESEHSFSYSSTPMSTLKTPHRRGAAEAARKEAVIMEIGNRR